MTTLILVIITCAAVFGITYLKHWRIRRRIEASMHETVEIDEPSLADALSVTGRALAAHRAQQNTLPEWLLRGLND